MSEEKQMAEWHAEAERQRADTLEARLRATEIQIAALRQMPGGSSSVVGSSDLPRRKEIEKGNGSASSSPTFGWNRQSAALDTMLFAGNIIALPGVGHDTARVECQEALAVFGSTSIEIPANMVPEGASIGTVLCFRLVHMEDESPQVATGSVI